MKNVVHGYEVAHNPNTGEAFTVSLKTGEVSGVNTLIVPDGTLVYTPDDQERRKRWNEMVEREAIREQRIKNNKQLGRFSFVSSQHNFSEIKAETMARLVYLSTYLSFDNNKLMRTERTPMSLDDLESVLMLSASTLYRFLKEVLGTYLLLDEEGGLYFSDIYFYRGELGKITTHPEYQKIYIDAVQHVYRKSSAPAHRYLGYIYQMIPFINFEYNVICHNPHTTILEDIEPMTVDEFCNAIRYSTKQRLRLIRNYANITFPVRGREERFCSFVFDGQDISTAKIFVNPRILHRGSNWDYVAVLGCFQV